MEPWRTGIAQADASSIRLLGYDVVELSQRASFTDVIFLLHRGRLPGEGERRLLDAILIGGADHGAERRRAPPRAWRRPAIDSRCPPRSRRASSRSARNTAVQGPAVWK